MKAAIELFFHTFKVFLLFMGCTLLFYYGILWISEEYDSIHRYDEPHGKAVKVFQMQENETTTISERLIWFYRIGE